MEDEFERGQLHSPVSEDQLLPKDFFDILLNRYLPIVSLTFTGTVIAYALKTNGMSAFFDTLLHDKNIYLLALYGAIWVSVPAVLWVLMKSNSLLTHHADLWYKVTAGMMAATLLLSLMLFPMESGLLAKAQNFIVAVLPVHILMYIYFVKDAMPPVFGVPLSCIGVGLFCFGMFIV